MGIDKKHGKGRLDKWYKLAKEKGYRARAAFKLIQLNRKYMFLEKSRVLLDLCAAPGSWCQVAAEIMPTNSLIVGVDLAPIKPIPRTITFQSDITTDKCRATIRQHLKTWKADAVLHDGAPNVGIAWVQDAYSQAELTLQALKLAIDFLAEGGTFVTKVFRSKDYNALLWVLNQLFCKVEATKPPSSRNVSAEIFVVCRAFKAPKRIDPRLLDPRSVFAELADPTPNNEAKVFNPTKKKRKREGYEEGDYVQFKEAPASEFVQTMDPIAMLGSYSKFSFDQASNGNVALAALVQLPETTNDVKNCCADLKVLGRKEFRLLLRWRLKAREIFGFTVKDENPKTDSREDFVEVSPMDDELRAQTELEEVHSREISRQKRTRRRDNEKKQKDIVRMQLHMMAPTDIGLEQVGLFGEGAVFDLGTLHRSGAANKIAKDSINVSAFDDADSVAESVKSMDTADEVEDGLEEELDRLYNQYQQRKVESNAKSRARQARSEHADGDWEGFPEGKEDQRPDHEATAEMRDMSSEDEDSLATSRLVSFENNATGQTGAGLSRKTARFFEQDIFRDIDGLSIEGGQDSGIDMDGDFGSVRSPYENKGENGQDAERKRNIAEPRAGEVQVRGPNQQHTAHNAARDTRVFKSPSSLPSQAQTSSDDIEIVRLARTDDWTLAGGPASRNQTDIDIVTAEAMTLAQQLASGHKSSLDVIDEGFNRYAFRDRDGLPEWFLHDESQHSKLQKPITAAAAAAIKAKFRALNARPIKKVREAKDRKKLKAAQKLERLREKSTVLADDEGISEKDKAQNISKLMNRAAKKKPKRQVRLVVAKGGNRGISGRPKGVKGKYKIVDPRLKKDVRAEKRIAKLRR